MVLTPAEFLILMLVTTTAGALVYLLRRRRQIARLRALAEEWRMHFSAGDRFQLGSRVAGRLEVPGAAGVRVVDLLYAIEHENHRYVFCAQYTVGVLRGKRGVRRVATLAEPRDRTPVTRDGPEDGPGEGAMAGAEQASAARTGEIEFAPASLSLIEQYRHLLEKCARG